MGGVGVPKSRLKQFAFKVKEGCWFEFWKATALSQATGVDLVPEFCHFRMLRAQCGKLCPTHDTSIKRWRHLNFFQYECLLEARVPRSHCPEHGVLSVAVPWAREGSGFTLLFEALAMLLCREMPMAAVSNTLGEHDTRLWRVAAHYVEAAHAKSSWAKVRAISVDETSARRGHRYVTMCSTPNS